LGESFIFWGGCQNKKLEGDVEYQYIGSLCGLMILRGALNSNMISHVAC